MSRLPVPGSDDNTWGDVLNDFLQVAHAADGSLRTSALPLDADTGLSANSDAKIATQKATKGYIDTRLAGGTTPDATTSAKGKVQLAGDLAGTAASPQTKSRSVTKTVGPSGSAADYLTTSYVSDDLAIQAAINAVNTAGGGTVLVREGTYRIATVLAIKDGVALVGQGRGKTIFRYQTGTLSTTNIIGLSSGSVRLNNIAIRDITFDAQDQMDKGLANLNGIVTKLEISNCEFLNMNCPNNSRWTLRIGTINDADVTGSASFNVAIHHNIFKNNTCGTFEVILLPNVRDSWVHHNNFEGNATSLTDEVSIYGQNINLRYSDNIHKDWSDYAVGAKESDQIEITNNTFVNGTTNGGQRAVRLYNLVNSRCSFNNIAMAANGSNAGYGIFMQDYNTGRDGHGQRNVNSANIDISDNIITNAYYGIANMTSTNANFAYKHITVNRNKFYNIGKSPIRFGPNTTGATMDIQYIFVQDNIIHSWSGDFEGGISFYGDASDVTMMKNIFIDRNFVANNTTGGSSGGIRVSAATVERITQNYVTASGGFGAISLPNGSVVNRKFNNVGDDSGTLETITNVQGATLYRTTDKQTNYERGTVYWNGTTFTMATQQGGSGTSRSIALNKGTSDGKVNLNGASPWVDIGIQSAKSTASTIVASIGSGTLSLSGAGTQYAVQVTPTITQGSTAGYTALLVNPTETSVGSGTKLLADFQAGGSSKASIDNAGTMTLGGGVKVHRTTVADTAYTVLATDHIVAVTTLTASRTITLPTAVGVTGQEYIIKDESGSATSFTIAIATTSSQTIDGAAASTKNIASNYGVLRVYSNGANWITF